MPKFIQNLDKQKPKKAGILAFQHSMQFLYENFYNFTAKNREQLKLLPVF